MLGASAVLAVSLFLVSGRLDFTLDNVAGVVVPFGPFTEVMTSVLGISLPVPSGFSKNLTVLVPSPLSTSRGYTLVPSAFV